MIKTLPDKIPEQWLVFALTVQLMAVIFFNTTQAHAQSAGQTGIVSLSYCIDPDWMPYEAIKNGQHVGISADYLALVGKYANLRLRLIPTQSWDQTLSLLQEGKCDLVSMLNRTPEREKYLRFTAPFFLAENVFVTSDAIPYVSGYESLRKKRLGIVRNYRHQEYVEQYYPELDVVLVDSESLGLLALSAGEIDVMVGSMLSVASYIQSFGLDDLKVSGLAKPHDTLSMGVIPKHESLIPRLNAAIAQINEQQHVEIYRKWNKVTVVEHVDYSTFIIALVIVSMLGGFIVWRNIHVTRFNKTLVLKNQLLETLQEELLDKNKQLEFLSNRDELTGLFNRHYMQNRCKHEIARCNRVAQPTSLIIFDIDHFKAINDTHGHSLGDQILRQLADLVSGETREVDVLARWGGEEFLVLCPQTSLNEANLLARRIQDAIAECKFDIIHSLTCSYGIAQRKADEDLDSWFDRADNAMYQVKRQGRNSINLAD